ncbi:MAG: branched-chain amino acid ABC transporter permease [Thermodesulfobacteriota bacterium]
MMKRTDILVGLAILASGLLAPLFISSPVWITTLNIFFYYSILSISYNIVFGYTGLFSFCHVTFGAIGGYTSALLAQHAGLPPFLGLVLGGLAAGLTSLVLGFILLRVRGFYLCLVTWAFGMVMDNVIKTEHQITGGTGGFLAPTFFSGPRAGLYAYFVGLGLLLLMYVVSAWLMRSRWGLYLFAVRDDLDAAETMGVRTRFWKVFGFVFGSAWAGVAGAFYAHFFSLVDPSIGALDEMGKLCLMVIIGGLGTLYGPILGTFFVVIMSEFIRGFVAEQSILIFAVVMMLTMRFARGGFMQVLHLIFAGWLKESPEEGSEAGG